MSHIEQQLKKVREQEATLQFESFSIALAHEIGAALMKKAVEGKKL